MRSVIRQRPQLALRCALSRRCRVRRGCPPPSNTPRRPSSLHRCVQRLRSMSQSATRFQRRTGLSFLRFWCHSCCLGTDLLSPSKLSWCCRVARSCCPPSNTPLRWSSGRRCAFCQHSRRRTSARPCQQTAPRCLSHAGHQ